MASEREPTSDRVVLLFCHGGSFTKETWQPIIRRLRESDLLRDVPVEYAAMDWRYHGEKSDPSTPGQLTHPPGGATRLFVEHDAREWTEWAPVDLLEYIDSIRADDGRLRRTTRIIGIGHSMGGSSLLKIETMLRPGTLDGIIAFEPICEAGVEAAVAHAVTDMMITNTIKRESQWETWDQVLAHFTTAKAYKKWDPEALEAFLVGGVRKVADGSGFRLAMSPLQEASLYCHKVIMFKVDDFARAHCPIFFEFGERTPLFSAHFAESIVNAFPGQVFLGDAILGAGHNMVMEAPAACAERILTDLAQLSMFHIHVTGSKL